MRQQTVFALAASAATSNAAAIQARASSSSNSTSLADACTVANVQAALPANGTFLGINPILSTVTASPVYNSSSGGMGGMGMSSSSAANYPYCNVTVAYARPGKSDVVIKYALPQPSDFQNRFYVAGGGGYSLSSTATGGLEYGAVSGATDAGYDAFSVSYDEVALLGNGSVNWDATYMFGYEALGEMTILGKALTKSFYTMSNSSKLYTYYEGCSDGGREGMSQVQRFGAEYDGAITGAPAFRYAHQQTNHIFSSAVESIQDYYPPPCALAKIVNATIAACDPLDGRTDGVVSRTDLCMLNFNLSSIIGTSYYCAAETSTSLGFGFSGQNTTSSSGGMRKRQAGGAAGSSTSGQPAQNGTVTAADVAVAQAIYDGLHNSQGGRAYLSWQIGSEFTDAETTWDNTTSSWKLSIPSTGGEYIAKFIQLENITNLSNLDGVTYDTVVQWMQVGYDRYLDSLQTAYPDLTDFRSNGGKLLHYHGESDPSVPAASSVHYWQSVRETMYNATATSNSSDVLEEMASWYQLYLVPGAAHCGANSLQPGPYPQDNMATMIEWVENGVQPSRLNGTVSSGTNKGEVQEMCQWPERPLWTSNTTDFDCVYDQASIDSWTYTFPAFNTPIY